jgi:hypothetical protein
MVDWIREGVKLRGLACLRMAIADVRSTGIPAGHLTNCRLKIEKKRRIGL